MICKDYLGWFRTLIDSIVAESVLLQNYISFSIFVSLLDKGRSMLKKDDLIGNIIGVVAFGIVLTLRKVRYNTK